MQSTSVNDVTIYNLSMGRALPDWLSSRKRRKLLKSDSSLRNRIQLIQDFVMPGVSQCIGLSPDGQYVAITGTYKPRVKCFDTNQLALKFERCFDAEVTKFLFLSDDFSKLLFLEEQRWLEFHNQSGRYFRIRIPRAGHDMVYCKSKCDLYIVGVGSTINRLNLEVGRFNSPLETQSIALNSCAINPVHELFVSGSKDGIVEAFDPRCDRRVGRLDIAFSSVTADTQVDGLPSVTSLTFKDSLHMAVGTATGQILIYDLRSSKPLVVKDHFYGLPIKKTVFIPSTGMVASMDEKILKVWKEKDGSPYTAIQTANDLNDLCIVPDTGMVFLANEDTKIQSFFIPSLGPAPKWASFLDRIVEEMEEDHKVDETETSVPGVSFGSKATIYEDYKFVTETQLKQLGLDHLIGTNLLRAYMHGFFIDIRLYNKAKDQAEPFKYDDYKKKKIQEKLEASRSNRVIIKSSLPVVNRELATQLMRKQGVEVMSDEDDDEMEGDMSDFDASQVMNAVRHDKDAVESQSKKKTERGSEKKKKLSAKGAESLLQDDRFKALFVNKDFEVDPESQEYKARITHAAASEKKKKRKIK